MAMFFDVRKKETETSIKMIRLQNSTTWYQKQERDINTNEIYKFYIVIDVYDENKTYFNIVVASISVSYLFFCNNARLNKKSTLPLREEQHKSIMLIVTGRCYGGGGFQNGKKTLKKGLIKNVGMRRRWLWDKCNISL